MGASLRLRTCCLLVLAVAVPFPLAAEVVPEPTIVVGSRRLEPEEPPRLAATADGSFVVVWASAGRVVGRTFDATGQPRGSATPLSPNNRSIRARLPQAAALPDGTFLVIWSQHGSSAIHASVQAVVLDANGQPLRSAQSITASDAIFVAPETALAVDRTGVVTIAWSQSARVLVQRWALVAGELLPLAPAFDAGRGGDPALALVPGGVVVAASTGELLDGDTFKVLFARQFSYDGTPRGAEYFRTVSLFDPHPQLFVDPHLVSDAAGRTLLMWYQRSEGYAAVYDRIRVQPFAADGTPSGVPVDLVVGDPWLAPSAERPVQLSLGDAVARPDGSFLLTWSRNLWTFICGGPGTVSCSLVALEGEVLARAFAVDGAPLGEPLVLAGGPGASTSLGAGAAARHGGWLAAHHAEQIAVTPLRDVGCDSGAGETTLCLGGRYRVEVDWQTANGFGTGRPLSLSTDTGGFWFFSPGNLELAVKVLDGTEVNGHHWVFFASLTDVEFELVVTDTVTGVERRYANPRGTLASRADVVAFPEQVASGASRELAGLESAAHRRLPELGPSAAGPAAAALAGGRFTATVDWRLRDGTGGTATAVPLSDDTALFWFFSPQNLEMAVKVLDGTAVNGHHWVFFASLSDVEFDLTVVDHLTGERRTYRNPAGTMASRADVEALP